MRSDLCSWQDALLSLPLTCNHPIPQCGGDAVSVEAARPLLMAMGKRLIHCGEHGSGQVRDQSNEREHADKASLQPTAATT